MFKIIEIIHVILNKISYSEISFYQYEIQWMC